MGAWSRCDSVSRQKRPHEPPRIDPVDGCFTVPERPGLGLKLDHEACAAHPRTGGRLQLFEEGWERRGFGPRNAPGERRA